jgi:hypothetical protein
MVSYRDSAPSLRRLLLRWRDLHAPVARGAAPRPGSSPGGGDRGSEAREEVICGPTASGQT